MNWAKRSQAVRTVVLLAALSGPARLACAQPSTINGAYDPAFGSALCVQTDATGFGALYNELDAAYGFVAGGELYLFY